MLMLGQSLRVDDLDSAPVKVGGDILIVARETVQRRDHIGRNYGISQPSRAGRVLSIVGRTLHPRLLSPKNWTEQGVAPSSSRALAKRRYPRFHDGYGKYNMPAGKTRTKQHRPMIDRDVWIAANEMIKLYGEDAGVKAAIRADGLNELGDEEGYATWKQVLRAINELRSTQTDSLTN